MALTLQSVLKQGDKVVSRALEDGRVAVRLDDAVCYSFNASASRIWELLDGARTLAQVAVESGEAESDVLALARDLTDARLFVPIADDTDDSGEEQPVRRNGAKESSMRPRMLAAEPLEVLGGCTSTSLACSFPSSTQGGPPPGKGPPGGTGGPPPGKGKG